MLICQWHLDIVYGKQAEAVRVMRAWGAEKFASSEFRRARGARLLAGLVGPSARDRLVARMRDLQRLSPALDAALAAGAQKLTSLQFSTGRGEQARQEALKEATQQAKRNAELMAVAAGGKLGRLLDLSTDRSPFPEALYEAARAGNMTLDVGAGSAGTAIKPANIETRVAVHGRWEFVPGGENTPGC